MLNGCSIVIELHQVRDEGTFASARIKDGVMTVHHVRCESCMCGQHPKGPHGWAELEDIIHALRTGQPDPAGQSCGCDCVNEEPDELEPDEDPEEYIRVAMAGPCLTCGEPAACAYDAEGRPLIHAVEDDDE